MNIFITGISGFIGRSLAMDLVQRGHHVFGSVSRLDSVSLAKCEIQCYVVRLNEEFDPTIFRDVDVVVHCAHDMSKGKSQDNRAGTKKLAEAAARQGVRRQLFISSYSAHAGAASEYGRTKFELEQFFFQSKHTVAKPGLVIGNGGLFAKICKFLRKYPLVPLIGRGNGKVPVISLRDLTVSIVRLIEQPRPGVFRFHNHDLVTLRELLQNTKSAGNFRTLMFPVPLSMVDFGLRLLGRLGVGLPVDSENLRGFQANQNLPTSSDLHEFVPRPMTLGEMIEVVFETSRANPVKRALPSKT